MVFIWVEFCLERMHLMWVSFGSEHGMAWRARMALVGLWCRFCWTDWCRSDFLPFLSFLSKLLNIVSRD